MLLHLDDAERRLVLKALRKLDKARASELAAKIANAATHPQITVGVYGGQVQWILGSPTPIRVCDYDGEPEDLPNVDERGQRCRIWFEPPHHGRV